MMRRHWRAGVLLCGLLLGACQQQTWESAMAAGQQAMQRGNFAEAARIFAAAAKKAEDRDGLRHRHVGVALSSEAQALAAQGSHVDAEPLYLQALKIYQDAHGEIIPTWLRP
ncbi:MAG: hypothetical protein U0412_03395 [Nitrospira sp.]